MSRGGAGPDPGRIARLLSRWFLSAARPLPWRAVDPRTGRRDPYLSLVSEFMLQQTQVSRVLELWPRFVGRFPTVRALARAPESAVMAAWSGMGYYRRARFLHAAARVIVGEHGGSVPDDLAALRALPGVGAYTAGAIASIAFGRCEPAADGNVARVFLRLHARALAHASAEAGRFAWERAAAVAGAAASVPGGPGPVNEALMELGATVCTPRSPACGRCPLADLCVARARGVQGEIPLRRAAPERRVVYAATALVRDGGGRVLVERRPEGGMWGSMWQAPTWESPRKLSAREAGGRLGLDLGARVAAFRHQTTHREVRFTVWEAPPPASVGGARRWRTAAQLGRLALSNPQKKILLGAHADDPRAGDAAGIRARRAAPAPARGRGRVPPGSPRRAGATSAGRRAR